jgi:GDP-4-dehydro-6-deoxy-D-mannose reductase
VDVPVIYAGISRLKEETGWQPDIALEDTLKDTLEYWRNETKKGNMKQP